ncbi:MAG TPA: STAS domain-containing protein [Polyangiaceae bacterium]|nr:STAS domain-containing protein [Polyangiaceae bacterium]
MAISTERNAQCWRIELSGRFDFSCRTDFRASYVDAPEGTHFQVDLSRVDYVDSSALGMLLLLRDRAGDGSRVRISGCRGQPEQVLRIANFQRLFRFE